jgi:hypothetical protein
LDFLQSLISLISPLLLAYNLAFGYSKLDPFGIIPRYITFKHQKKILHEKFGENYPFNDNKIELDESVPIFVDKDKNSSQKIELIEKNIIF